MTEQQYSAGDPRGVYARLQPTSAAPAPHTLNGVPVDNTPPVAPGGTYVPPVPKLSGEPDQRANDAYKLLQNVGDKFEEHAQQVDRDAFDSQSGRWRLGPEDRKAAVEGFAHNPFVQQQINEAVGMVESMRDERAAEVDQLRAGLIPQRDTAAEIKAQRDWARRERILDSVSDGERARLANQMLEQTSSPAEFATLVEELGPYLQSKGVPTEWLEGSIAQRIPALGEARQKLSVAERQLTKTKYNAERQRNWLATGQRAKHLVKPD